MRISIRLTLWSSMLFEEAVSANFQSFDICYKFALITFGANFGDPKCIGNFCSGISWGDSRRDTMMLGDVPGQDILCSDALSFVIRYRTLIKILKQEPKSKPSETIPAIGLRYLESPRDPRGRLSVRFESQSSLNDKPFVLMLDTASDYSYIRLRASHCQRRSYGYLDQGKAYVKQKQLMFGTVHLMHGVNIQKEISEIAQLENGFRFKITIGLTQICNDPNVGTGLLGGGFASNLANSVGIFSIVPPRERFNPQSALVDAGSLHLGIIDYAKFCRQKNQPTFIPISYPTYIPNWIIPGSILVNSQLFPSFNWWVDTGAGDIILPSQAYMWLIQHIQGAGGLVYDISPSKFNTVMNCARSYKSFPSLTIRLGMQAGHIFDYRLTPLDYLNHYTDGSCSLMVYHSEVSGAPNTGILGSKFLERVVSIFDKRNRRMGFCVPQFSAT